MQETILKNGRQYRSHPVYEPKYAYGEGGGGVAESQPMSTAVHMELK